VIAGERSSKSENIRMGKVFGAVATIVLIAVFLGVGWFAIQRFLTKDYSQDPPAQTYQMVMGTPVPKGISSVVAAGHSLWQTNMVWLKLQGTPKALLGLTRDMNPVAPKDFHYSAPANLPGGMASDAAAAGWTEVPSLPHPLYFIFRSKTSDGMWVGTMVISSSTHTAYVSAQHQ
jgi:hypothetical protein